MAESTVTNRKELVEAARALYLQINDVATVAGILHAATRAKGDSETYGFIVGAEAVSEYAVKALQERLDGIYERMDTLFECAGLDGSLFSDEAMGLA